MLRSTESVVSGSVALHFMMPWSRDTAPTNLNVHTPDTGYAEMRAYLANIGYSPHSVSQIGLTPIGPNPSYVNSAVEEVTRMMKGDMTIDLMETRPGDNAFEPIFNYQVESQCELISEV